MDKTFIEEHTSRASETVEILAKDPAKIPIVKIVDIIRDPLSNPLVSQELMIFVNGRL